MSKLIASFVLAASLLAGIGAASAAPYGMSFKERAESNQFTPHGIFDAR